MAIEGINNVQAVTSTRNTKEKDDSTLSMDDFFKLMVAQLQNQDMYNSVDNTEYMSQMAQYSMVEALSGLREMTNTSYSVSLIGKEVSVSKTEDDGTKVLKIGVVEGVNLSNGNNEIVIDGATYPLSSIMEVRQAK
jgi:flagellar basal-body rod modification protein FlgD